MSLVSASISSNRAWETLQGTTTQLRTGCLALEQSLQQIFHEVEQMRLELVDRLQEVEQERQRLDSGQESSGHQGEESMLADALAQREAELSQTRSELLRVRAELEERDRASAKAVEGEAADLRVELSSLRELLESLRGELEAVRKQRDAFQVRAEIGEADQVRLADVEAELVETRRQLKAERSAASEVHATAPVDSSLTLSPEQFSALEQERAALEEELELVRNRAAELRETVTLQQREMAEQKTELSGELQQLRRLMEKQTDLIADRGSEPDFPVPVAEQLAVENLQSSDPVVNSVMAQFAKLQKDVALRRRRKSN